MSSGSFPIVFFKLDYNGAYSSTDTASECTKAEQNLNNFEFAFENRLIKRQCLTQNHCGMNLLDSCKKFG